MQGARAAPACLQSVKQSKDRYHRINGRVAVKNEPVSLISTMSIQSCIRWAVIPTLMLLLSSISKAENTKAPSPHLDRLERRLELGRHEQLVEIKNDPNSVLADLTTDGCSGGLSVGWEYLARKIEGIRAVHGSRPPWESCCIEHDKTYHTAGSRDASANESFVARKNADLALRVCVLETGRQRLPDLSAAYAVSAREVEPIYTAIAALMYRAVRLGGVPCSGLPWRWGYGWPNCK